MKPERSLQELRSQQRLRGQQEQPRRLTPAFKSAITFLRLNDPGWARQYFGSRGIHVSPRVMTSVVQTRVTDTKSSGSRRDWWRDNWTSDTQNVS